MKRILVFALLCFVVNKLAAQSRTVKLWPGAVPGQTAEKHQAVLRDSLQHVTRVTDITDPLLTVFAPNLQTNLHAAIIISPGGGNKYLAIDLEGYEVAQWLCKLGYTAFVLNYRVPNQQTGALQDAQRAISVVRSNAKWYNIDTNRIGVMGFSAGGNLSARAMTNFNKRTYQPVDKLDSSSCRPDFALLIYPGSLANSTNHQLIQEIPVSKNTPQTFIFVAADDQFGPPFALAAALKDNKVPFEFHVYPRGGHGYGLRKGNPAAETWPELAQKWLKTYILKK